MSEGLEKIEVAPIYAHVAERLREAILSGDIPPGSSLPTERELSDELGVSRTSVREALRALQAEGLVADSGRTSPLRTTIPDESDQFLRKALSAAVRLRRVSLDDLIGVRCIVEGSALELAAERSVVRDDPKAFAEAEECLGHLREPNLSLEEFDKRDVGFHLAIDALAENEALFLVMTAIAGAMADKLLMVLTERHADQGTFDKLNAEHGAMLEAIRAGKGVLARELLVAHVMGFYGTTPEGRPPGG